MILIRFDKPYKKFFNANNRKTNITNKPPQCGGGFTFPEANGQCVGGKGESEQNYEFSRNEGGESGCVVGS